MARILVAEDNFTNLELITSLLKAFGHEALEAHNGEQALEIAQQERPDLVLMDIHMPVMDGYEAACRLRKDSTIGGIPMIAITALAMVGDREKILQAGFDGYITKPIDAETFVQELDPYLLNSPSAAPRRPMPLASEINPHQTALALGPSTSNGLTVMVVDNLPTNILVMRSLLEPSGYQVVSASNGREALAILRKDLPDLIVCDVHMPGLSGYDVLRAVRSEFGLLNIPFMIISSTALTEDDSEMAVRLGADKFVTRPIEPPKLLAEIEACLRKAA